MNTIELTWDQILLCATAGVMREMQYQSRSGKVKDGMVESDRGWGTMIEGALSEYALAQYLGKHWVGVGKVGGNDLDTEEVRVTELPNGSLIIRPEDKDEKRYWLVTGKAGKYIIRGFILGKDAKQIDCFGDKNTDKPKAWFVPQKKLIKPEEYKNYV